MGYRENTAQEPATEMNSIGRNAQAAVARAATLNNRLDALLDRLRAPTPKPVNAPSEAGRIGVPALEESVRHIHRLLDVADDLINDIERLA